MTDKVRAIRQERKINELIRLPGNSQCADCCAKNPRWASYSLGVLLCMRCASLHRKMGTHISKVKSLSMDAWTSDQLQAMEHSGGNEQVNGRINPHPDQHPLPINVDDEMAMEHFIRQKWEKRSFEASTQVSPEVAVVAPTSSTSTADTSEPPAGQVVEDAMPNPFKQQPSLNPFLQISHEYMPPPPPPPPPSATNPFLTHASQPSVSPTHWWQQ
ncbi:hypothetical protein BC940DRAFT_334861 [Gongronella butleri]|nr:hypothetical protein BC940DRAFT_334861 [Gongronella butleri]